MTTPASEHSVYFDAIADDAEHIAQPPLSDSNAEPVSMNGAQQLQGEKQEFKERPWRNSSAGAADIKEHDFGQGTSPSKRASTGPLPAYIQNDPAGVKHDTDLKAPAFNEKTFFDDVDNKPREATSSAGFGGQAAEKYSGAPNNSTTAVAQAGDETPKANAPTPTTATADSGAVRDPSLQQQTPTMVSGAFASGAVTTSPSNMPEPDAAQQQRVETAENQLPAQSVAKITKAEAKDAKRLIKVIKAEGKAQSLSLSASFSDLNKQQKLQKGASSDEAHALKAYSKATKYEHKLHTKALAAKAKHEQAMADLKAKEELLTSTRVHALKMNEMLGAKAKEVEELRRQKAVDDREREAKLKELTDLNKK